jgi:hypothetical protein
MMNMDNKKFNWLEKVLNEEYCFVKNLKKNDTTEINVLENKSIGKKLVLKRIQGTAEAYAKLLHIVHRNIPVIYDVAMNDDRTIVISTHQVRDIDKILDHILIMNEERVLLDAAVCDICREFVFVESDDAELQSNAFYSIPSLQGNMLMLRNEGGMESDVNLELLFGAVASNPEKVASVLNPKDFKCDESK